MALNLERFFYCKITFKLKTAPYTSTVRWFGTSTYLGATAFSTQTNDILGIIRAIGGLGNFIRGPIPDSRSGSITLDNTRGSVDRFKRFTDFLETEEIINQVFELHAFEKPVGATGTFATGNIPILKARVDFVSASNSSNEVTISFKTDVIKNDILQTEVTLGRFPQAPSRSIHKLLPLCFNSTFSQPVVIGEATTTGSNTGIDYAYATTVGTTFKVQGITADGLLYRNFDEQYVNCVPGGTVDAVLQGDISSDTTYTIQSYQIAQMFTGADTFLFTNFQIKVTTASSFNGTLQVAFYRDINDQPGDLITAVDISGLTGSATQTLRKGLRNCFVIEEGVKYWIGFSYANRTTGTISYNARVATQQQDWELSTFLPGESGWVVGSLRGIAAYTFHSVVLTDSKGATGTNAATFDLTTWGVDYLNSNFPNLALLVELIGLEDDSGGTLTGTANQRLESALDVVRFIINRGFDNLDDAALAPNAIISPDLPGTFPRSIKGSSQGRQSSTSILSQVLQESGCILIPVSDGTVRLWAYGAHQTSSALIREDRCRLIKYEIQDLTTIVNKIQLAYDRQAQPVDVESITVDSQRSNFSSVLEWDNTTGGSVTAWTNDSFNIYGSRLLDNRTNELNWVADSQSAEALAQYYLQVFALAKWVFTIEVPFFEENYRDLELIDIVEIEHNDNPSATGSSWPEDKWPYYNGAENLNLTAGLMWRMAKKYRSRIIGKEIILNLVNPQETNLRLSLQIINNPHEIS